MAFPPTTKAVGYDLGFLGLGRDFGLVFTVYTCTVGIFGCSVRESILGF